MLFERLYLFNMKNLNNTVSAPKPTRNQNHQKIKSQIPNPRKTEFQQEAERAMNGSVTSKVPLKNQSPNKTLNQSRVKSSKSKKEDRQSTLGILKISSNESRFQENNQHLKKKRGSLNES